jgi:hypothetical protein
MTKLLPSLVILLAAIGLAAGLTACGGGSSSARSSNGSDTAANASCTNSQPPTLGSTTFGSGCFK